MSNIRLGDAIIRNNAALTFEPRYLCCLDIIEFQPHAATESILRDENCAKFFQSKSNGLDLVTLERSGNILEMLNSAKVDSGASGQHGA
jgi:hypothetical protein